MRNTIKLLAADYEVGDQTELIECPFCGGGATGEKSFTMSIEPEGILYICYRASCGRKGFVPNLRFEAKPVKHKQKEPNHFQNDISDLPEMMIPFLVSKFPCLTEEVISYEQLRYSYERERILLPMFDVRGFQFGLQARSYKATPKAISYFDSLSVPKMHFPLGYRRSTHVTLVEDHFSAMILCHAGIPSVCLLGTNLSDEDVSHLLACGITSVTFFLDADAAAKAVHYKKKYGLELSTSVYYHDKDPKDLYPAELQEFKQWLVT